MFTQFRHQFHQIWGKYRSPQNISELLQRVATNYPAKDAVVCDEVRLTFSELNEQAMRVASGLSALGVKRGEWVGLMLPNCPEFIVSFLALAQLGAVVAPVDIYYRQPELERMLRDGHIRALITSSEFLEVAEAAVKRCPAFKLMILKGSKSKGYPSLAGLLNSAEREESIRSPIKPKDSLLYLYTSGTTGIPKGLLLSHAKVIAIGKAWRKIFSITEDDKCYTLAPLFRSPALLSVIIAGLYYGITMVIPPTFRPHQVWQEIAAENVSFFHACPFHFAVLANLPAREPLRGYWKTNGNGKDGPHRPHPIPLPILRSSAQALGEREVLAQNQSKIEDFLFLDSPSPKACAEERSIGRRASGRGVKARRPTFPDTFLSLPEFKLCYSSGNRLPPKVAQAFEERFGITIDERYGTSEVGGICRNGFALNGVDIKLLDEEGKRITEQGGIGEIVVKTPLMETEYYNLPDLSHQPFKDGWFHTGDVGKIDEEGRLKILYRKKRTFVIEGQLVHADEIERILRRHPQVKEVRVVRDKAQPEDVILKALVVLVVLKEPCPQEVLLKFLRRRLASYKIPQQIEFREELPRSWKAVIAGMEQAYPKWGEF